eukprot:COSAG01_NODE_32272_length_583_cov_47.386364_1_plen_48_part_01
MHDPITSDAIVALWCLGGGCAVCCGVARGDTVGEGSRPHLQHVQTSGP